MPLTKDTKTLLDPCSHTNLESYRGIGLVKPNEKEALHLSQYSLNNQNPEFIKEVAFTLQTLSQSDQVVITRGAKGLLLLDNAHFKEMPTLSQKVFDVTGAGDTVISCLAMGAAAKWPLFDSCAFANVAASLVIRDLGASTCSQEDILKYLQ